ncbi:MAG: hypothetical protein QME64_07020, partial [bacterium]|nr:hypothetical protein [bacterium]
MVLLGFLTGISIVLVQSQAAVEKVLVIRNCDEVRVAEDVIIAKGIGKPPTYAESSTQAKLMARRAAVV